MIAISYPRRAQSDRVLGIQTIFKGSTESDGTRSVRTDHVSDPVGTEVAGEAANHPACDATKDGTGAGLHCGCCATGTQQLRAGPRPTPTTRDPHRLRNRWRGCSLFHALTDRLPEGVRVDGDPHHEEDPGADPGVSQPTRGREVSG